LLSDFIHIQVSLLYYQQLLVEIFNEVLRRDPDPIGVKILNQGNARLTLFERLVNVMGLLQIACDHCEFEETQEVKL